MSRLLEAVMNLAGRQIYLDRWPQDFWLWMYGKAANLDYHWYPEHWE